MNLKYPWQLYHWHLELSAKCTLKCPRCPRNDQDRVSWMNKDISLETFKRTFTPEFILENVERFTFCGDIGDPIYNREFLDIVRYIKDVKPTCHTFTITNGSHKPVEWWQELAGILNEYDSVNFSVDGYDQDSNNIYRINSNFNSIFDGMSTLGHSSKCFVNWATIYFSFNQDHQDDIRALAQEAGCDAIQWTKSTKFDSKYPGAYPSDPLEPREEYISSTHRYERHMEYLTDRRVPNEAYMFTNDQMYTKVDKEYTSTELVPLCLVGNRGMYLSADGTVHPCSWTSFPFKAMSDGRKTINYEDSFFYSNREDISINYHSLEEVLNHPRWNKLFSSFEFTDKTWVECNTKCNRCYVDYDYAVGYETN